MPDEPLLPSAAVPRDATSLGRKAQVASRAAERLARSPRVRAGVVKLANGHVYAFTDVPWVRRHLGRLNSDLRGAMRSLVTADGAVLSNWPGGECPGYRRAAVGEQLVLADDLQALRVALGAPVRSRRVPRWLVRGDSAQQIS